MKPNIALIGSQTSDLIRINGNTIYTSGGIANVLRGLEDDVFYLPIHFASVSIGNSAQITNQTIHYEILDHLIESHWTHLAYLDWLDLESDQIEYIKRKTDILTVDVAGLDHSLEGLNFDWIDLVFCSDTQSPFIHYHNKFVHGKDKWDIYLDGEHIEYNTHPVDIDFTLGAGDTLAAKVICGTLESLSSSECLEEIEEELVFDLKRRDKWIKLHCSSQLGEEDKGSEITE